jgi:hypothetical protein
LLLALILTFDEGQVSAYDGIVGPARLDHLLITLLDYQVAR